MRPSSLAGLVAVVLAVSAASPAVAALPSRSAAASVNSCGPTDVPPGSGSFLIGGAANLLAFGAGSLWTLTSTPNDLGSSIRSLTLRRVDLVTGRVLSVGRYRGAGDAHVAFGAGAIWIADPERGTLTRIDAATHRRRVSRPLGPSGQPTALEFGFGRIWVISNNSGEVAKVDAKTNRTIRRITLGRRGLADIESGFGYLWVSTGDDGAVIRLDPRSEKSKRIALGGQVLDVAAGEGSVWADLGDRNVVARIDPANARLRGRPWPNGGGQVFAIAAGFGSVWATNYLDDTLTRIDITTGRIQSRTTVGQEPKDIAVAEGSVWVVNAGTCSISRIVPDS